MANLEESSEGDNSKLSKSDELQSRDLCFLALSLEAFDVVAALYKN